MKCIAVVPARGGSKGVPGKNLRPLAGKPLIGWTLESASEVRELDDIIVSTDDQEIAEVAQSFGASVPFVRPGDLAEDNVHAIHVILHCLDWLEREGRLPDAVMMILPTSPLRRSWHIRQALQTFAQAPDRPVISVYRSLTPMISFRWLEAGRLVPVAPAETMNMQRQDLMPLYGVNGSIYIAPPEVLRRFGTFHTETARPYVMDRLHSLDINSLDDFAMAEHLLKSPDFNLDKSLLAGEETR